jgi:hypothetical protein
MYKRLSLNRKQFIKVVQHPWELCWFNLDVEAERLSANSAYTSFICEKSSRSCIVIITVSIKMNSFVIVKYANDRLPSQFNATTGAEASNSSCVPNAGQFIRAAEFPSIVGTLSGA